jgi:hypothetical protein
MKYKYLKNILLAGMLLCSFGSWFSVDRAINVANSSVWTAPILWFSALLMFFFLGFITIKERLLLKIILAIGYLLSFVFIFDITRIVFLTIAILFAYIAESRIKDDLGENIRINVLKSLSEGKTLLIMSLALMVVSQYFSQIRSLNAELLIPQLELGKLSSPITRQLLKTVNPQFKDIETDKMTVDEFILEVQKKQMMEMEIIGEPVDIDKMIEQQIGETRTPVEKEMIKKEATERMAETKNKIQTQSIQLIVDQERERLSQMSGKALTGQERISDVLSDIVTKRISEFFQPKVGEHHSSVLPMIMAIVLFLTIISLANLLYIVISRLVQFSFYLLVKKEVITIKKLPMEVERLE